MKILLGLGNPGVQYSKTRHNIGQLFIDSLSDKALIGFKSRHYMNLSDKFVSQILQDF